MPQDPPQVMLGPAQYGKAEVRVLHVDRAAPRHENTVYAFARSGVRPVEEFALRLARHFAQVDSVDRARVRIEEYGWQRIDAGGGPHPHSFELVAGTKTISAC